MRRRFRTLCGDDRFRAGTFRRWNPDLPGPKRDPRTVSISEFRPDSLIPEKLTSRRRLFLSRVLARPKYRNPIRIAHRLHHALSITQ